MANKMQNVIFSMSCSCFDYSVYLFCWRCFSTRKFGALLAPALLFNPVIWRAAGPRVVRPYSLTIRPYGALCCAQHAQHVAQHAQHAARMRHAAPMLPGWVLGGPGLSELPHSPTARAKPRRCDLPRMHARRPTSQLVSASSRTRRRRGEL